MASELMPNPALPMRFFVKSHILTKKTSLNRKFQVETKKIFAIYHAWASAITKRASEYTAYTRGGQTCSMYETHILKPKLQRAAT